MGSVYWNGASCDSTEGEDIYFKIIAEEQNRFKAAAGRRRLSSLLLLLLTLLPHEPRGFDAGRGKVAAWWVRLRFDVSEGRRLSDGWGVEEVVTVGAGGAADRLTADGHTGRRYHDDYLSACLVVYL